MCYKVLLTEYHLQGDRMEQKFRVKQAIRNIGLALNASHNTIATDLPDIKPDKTSWRIDYANELKDLDFLEDILSQRGQECI